MDCSLPGSTVLGILQARILEWVAIPFSRGSSPMSEPPGKTFKTGDVTYLKVSGNNVVETINDAGDKIYKPLARLTKKKRERMQTKQEMKEEKWQPIPQKCKKSEENTVNNSVQFSSVTQSCPTLCEPMNCSMPGLPVHHQLPEFTQTHVHRVGDAIQPSHPLSSPSPPAPNPSQHQSLFQWVSSSHEVAKVLALASVLQMNTQD